MLQQNEDGGFVKATASKNKINASLHFPALWITLVVLALLVPSLFLLHRLQIGRLEQDLLDRVEAAKTKGDYPEAIKFLSRYLKYRPNSAEQEVEFTQLISEGETNDIPPANLVGMLYQAIGKCELNPGLEDRIPELREKLFNLLTYDAARLGEAVEQIAKITTDEQSPKWDKKLAEIRFRALAAGLQDPSIGRIKGAPKWVETRCATDPVDHVLSTLEENKGDVNLTAMISNAVVLNPSFLVKSRLAKEAQEDLWTLTRNKLKDMLEIYRDEPEAWIIDYQVNSRLNPDLADANIRKALELFPDNAEIKKQGAVHFMTRLQTGSQSGNVPMVREAIEQGESLLSALSQGSGLRSGFTYLSLYELYLAKGEFDKALQSLDDGIRVCEPPLALLHIRRAGHFNQT
jgi:tetratricopeptide (TPR) repeat protein